MTVQIRERFAWDRPGEWVLDAVGYVQAPPGWALFWLVEHLGGDEATLAILDLPLDLPRQLLRLAL